MHLVLNAINGEFLRNITLNSTASTERVDAAVAYVSREDLLFDWCWDNKIPLRFWGRFDENVPVATPILRRFLSRRSAHYTCKLVRKFHAKVIWWHGVGAYIGSANLSDSAWYSNVEAGTFYEEGELISLSLDQQLRELFRVLDVNGSPLTEEICRDLEARQRQISKMKASDAENANASLNNPNIKPWAGLVQVSKAAASDRRRAEFMAEWNDTLTLLRNLSDKVERNRPSWVSPKTPTGAHVDQFLHAHYYNRVMAGGRSYFEEWHERNASDPDAAEREALEWWRNLDEAPSNEHRMLNEWAPFLKERLSPDGLKLRTEDDLFEVFKRVHAISDHARRMPNHLVDLPGTRQYTIEEKTRALAHRAIGARSQGGHDVFELLEHVFYGGSLSDVPSRLWDGLSAPKWRIDHVGRSALGELVGWALPDIYPPRNARTSKSLRSLGHDVTV